MGGYYPWSSFMSAFKGMVNMQLTATDAPDLSQVTDMSSAFKVLQTSLVMSLWIVGILVVLKIWLLHLVEQQL